MTNSMPSAALKAGKPLSAYQAHLQCRSSSKLPRTHRVRHLTRSLIKSTNDSDYNQASNGEHSDVHGKVKEILLDDPETKAKLERVRQAAAAVAALQAQKTQLDRETTAANYASAWEHQDQEKRQAQRAAERGANADVLSAADDLELAQAELVASLEEKNKWSVAVDEEAEKAESAKAGAISAVGATVGSLPFVLTASSSSTSPLVSLTSLAAVCITGLLFGVTYRYAVRQDLNNLQLKGGVIAAFGLCRGLALAEETFKAFKQPSTVDALGAAAVAAGESMLSVGFAAAALELAFQRGLVKPFGSLSETNRPSQ